MSLFGNIGGGLIGAGALGSLLGGGKDPGKKQLAQMMGIYGQLGGKQAGFFANALQQQKQGLASIGKGYKTAMGLAGSQAATAKQGVLDRETANTGALKAGLAGSGMGGGTLQANLQRGVYSDTNRSLAGVDSALAELQANLMTQKAQLEANQYGALAGLFQNQSAQSTALGQSMIGTLGSVEHADPNAGWNALLGLGGQLGTASIFASDRRLKRDITWTGSVEGVNEYEFAYVGLPGRYRGVLADEVEHIPGAVHQIDDYRHVDYSRVPVKFRRVA
jgi:hypothetical protein